MMSRRWWWSLAIAGGLMFPTGVAAATPTVTNWSPVNTTVGRYQKFEANFSISKTYPASSLLPYYYYDSADTPAARPGRNSPYGVDGITIDAKITAPSGKQLTVPTFYFQDYNRTGGSSSETMTPTNNYSWKLRFTPEETGSYTYYVSITDREGTTRYPASGTLSFTSNSSSSRGFVRVSGKDSRFLAFSNGTSFIPIGSGRQWWNGGGRSYDYENAFSTWKNNGINFTRIWDQNDSYALTTEGRYDAYSFPDDYNPVDNFAKTGDSKYDVTKIPKGTQINQRGAYEKDKIIESAEANGVYIQLCAHEDPYWIWDASIHNESWNPNPRSFDDPEHVNYWKRNYRYRIARWGYSTAVMAWETWNEHGHILPGTGAYNFYQTLGSYLAANDPYRHIRTTSQGSQAYSPGLWSSGGLDMANYHDYIMSGRYSGQLYNDEAYFVHRFSWCLRSDIGCNGLGVGDGTSWSGAAKPWVWGELDIGGAGWSDPVPAVAQNGEGRIRMLHNTTWAGLFSPLGVSPLDWFWDAENSATTNSRYADRKATANFFAGMDYDGGNFTFLVSGGDTPSGYSGDTIGTTSNQIRVYGMRRSDRKAAYVWAQHKDYVWTKSSSTPASVTTTVTVPGLLNQAYKVEIWNTHTTTNQIMSTQTVTPTNGNLSVSLSGITNDVAVKVEATSGVPTVTVAPTSPPAATPTPVLPAGDANGDGRVDGIDYVIWLTNYNSSGPGGRTVGDFNGDGRTDGVDYIMWLTNYGG